MLLSLSLFSLTGIWPQCARISLFIKCKSIDFRIAITILLVYIYYIVFSYSTTSSWGLPTWNNIFSFYFTRLCSISIVLLFICYCTHLLPTFFDIFRCFYLFLFHRVRPQCGNGIIIHQKQCNKSCCSGSNKSGSLFFLPCFCIIVSDE